MKTPLPYYGGKSRLAKRIVDLMPAHQCYVEPYAGGLAVLFKKGLPENWTNGDHYREVINDIDSEIVEFWRELQNPQSEFHHRIKYTLYSKKEHERALIEKSAWATWVSTVQSFSSMKGGGWARGKGTRAKGVQNFALTFLERVAAMPSAAERMRGAYVECEDAIDLIKRWDTPYSLHYCDPPYPQTDCSPYKQSYSVEDYQRLIDTLADLKGSVMLSGYPLDGLNIPEDWERHEYKATNSVSSSFKANDERTKRTEVLYICDRSQAARDEGAILWSPREGWINRSGQKSS